MHPFVPQSVSAFASKRTFKCLEVHKPRTWVEKTTIVILLTHKRDLFNPRVWFMKIMPIFVAQ